MQCDITLTRYLKAMRKAFAAHQGAVRIDADGLANLTRHLTTMIEIAADLEEEVEILQRQCRAVEGDKKDQAGSHVRLFVQAHGRRGVA